MALPRSVRILPLTAAALGCLTAVALGALLTAGCSLGGQSTDEVSQDGGYDCEETVLEELSSDSKLSSELGFSVEDVAWAFRKDEVAGVWKEAYGISSNAKPGEVSVTTTLTRRKGSASVVDNGCGNVTLAIPVSLKIRTDDGLIREEMDVVLHAHHSSYASVTDVLDQSVLEGDLNAQAKDENGSVVQPDFSLQFNPTASSGSLNAVLEVRSKGAVSGSFLELLSWESEYACEISQIATPLSEADEPWVQLSTLSSSFEGEGSEGAYQVLVTPESVVCEIGGDPMKQAPHSPSSLQAGLELTTPDGLVLSMSGAFVEQEDTLVFSTAIEEASPSDFVQVYGDFGLELEEYDGVYLSVELSVAGSSQAGVVVVKAFANDCQSVCDENGCSGCPGWVWEDLLTIELSAVELEE